MNGNSTGAGPLRVASLGHAVFAAMMIVLGVLGLVQGDFTPTWSGVPKSVPAREALAYVCAVVSLLTGIGLLWKRTALLSARVLLISLLLWLLLFRLSHFFRDDPPVLAWWACGDTALMSAAAWVLCVWFAGDARGSRLGFAAGDRGLRIARILYGLALIPFGVAHFVYLNDTAPLVPSWLPWHTAWAYFTGGAFIAAGIAALIGVYARLAVTLSVVQMALFTLLIWVPIVVTGHPNAFQWSELVDSCALTAGAWVVADSYRVNLSSAIPRMRT